jgi:hypothetical protein
LLVLKLNLLLGLIALSAAACFNAEARSIAAPEHISPAEASPDAVHVSGVDFRFDIPTHSVKSGTVDFIVSNDGKERHEFAIVPVDGDRYGLPVGEIEPFDAGQIKALRIDLPPGKYQFVCLIVSVIDGEPRPHMARGMKADFEVTP